MVFNATVNTISAISWWPVLLVDEIGVPEEIHRTVASDVHWQTNKNVRNAHDLDIHVW